MEMVRFDLRGPKRREKLLPLLRFEHRIFHPVA
jgi:hypothetical protein